MSDASAMKSALRSIRVAAEKARVTGKKRAKKDEGAGHALLEALGLVPKEEENEGEEV